MKQFTLSPFYLLLALAIVPSGMAKDSPSAGLHSTVRGASVNIEQNDRDLFSLGGFSWANLLFSTGICHKPASTCPEYSNSACGCPKCDKKLIPPHLHSYCKKVKSGNGGSSSGGDGGNSSGGDGGDGGDNGDNSTWPGYNPYNPNGGSTSGGYNNYGGRNSNAGGNANSNVDANNGGTDGQQVEGDRSYNEEQDANSGSFLNPWVLLVVGTVFVAGVAGVVFQGGVMGSANGLLGANGVGAEPSTNYKLEGGSIAALGSVMAGFGVRPDGNTTDTDESSEGAVSRRLNLLSSGADVGALDDGGKTPGFVDVPAALTGPDTTIAESAEAIELQGPFRPSSY